MPCVRRVTSFGHGAIVVGALVASQACATRTVLVVDEGRAYRPWTSRPSTCVPSGGNKALLVIHVVDPMGGPIPGAEVKAESPDAPEIAVKTNDGGVTLLDLFPGHRYRVTVRVPGFVVHSVERFTARSGCTAGATLPLEVLAVP